MASGDGFAASPARLVSHAAHLDSVSASVGTAGNAARAVQIDSQAYGYLCAPLPILMGELDRIVGGAISAAASSMADTAVKMRSTADQYDNTERNNASDFDWLRGA